MFSLLVLLNEASVEDEMMMQHNSYDFVNEKTKWSRKGAHEGFIELEVARSVSR